jgi:LacI family transcriptional regulator
MITTDTIGRFSIPLLMGAEDALGAGEMSVFLCDARDDPIREQYYLRTLLSRRVDGIIVTGRRTQARPPIGLALPIPVVYAFISSTDPRDCSVVPDEAGGADRAIDHLLAAGRRRIAHITGPQSHESARERAAGAAAALTDLGMDLVGEALFGSWTEAWGRFAAAQVLRTTPDVDGFFCGNDVIARGVLDGLREAGVELPMQVGVVGIDNWGVIAEAARPPLTTVDLSLEEIGRRSGDLLLAAIDGQPAPGVHVVPGHLVVRES